MNTKSSLPDFFEAFKSIVFEIDTKNSMEERKKYLAENEVSFRQGLLALKESENWVALGVMLKIIEQFAMNSSVSFFETTPSHELCKNFDSNSEQINESLAEITFVRSKKLFEKAKTGKYTKKYLDRHRFIETAIRLVWELFPADASADWPYQKIQKTDACEFIARCYLLRSRLALPKGSDIPEKKIEAIQKAWDWLDGAGDEIDDLKIEIALEKDRWEKNLSEGWINEMIDKFFNNNPFNSSNHIHRAAYDRCCQTGIPTDDFDDAILKLSADNNDPFFFLHQAKAAHRTQTPDQGTRLEKAVSALSGVPLSYHLWDDTVDIIEKVAKKDGYEWCKSAIRAWQICRQEESMLKLSIQIRWYWSRQAKLYDLAFRAANDTNNPELAAQIADSLKSRPAIKLVQAENNLHKNDREQLETFREIETNFAAGNFHTGLEDAKKWDADSSLKLPNIQAIPSGWTAVHFYISLNNTGYAVVINVNGKNEIEKIEIELIEETWNAYKDWKAALQKAGDYHLKDTSKSLKKLCKACGKMLKPVLEKVNTDKIIFIPHGFLHLVPLHAAMINDDDPLFNTKTCLFLPAWSLTPDTSSRNKNDKSILLSNWTGKNHLHHLEKFINHKKWVNEKRTECTPSNYTSMFNSTKHEPPALLAFYCHGQGDFMNPYRSALKMHGGPLTHQAIVQETDKKALLGTKVILTACESDLVSGKKEIADEHLSIASAFLQKGASEVCGTLFKCSPDIAGDIIAGSLDDSNLALYETVHNVQRNWIKEKPDELYKAAAFRIMGFPVNNEEA